jgi:hypothetical protein
MPIFTGDEMEIIIENGQKIEDTMHISENPNNQTNIEIGDFGNNYMTDKEIDLIFDEIVNMTEEEYIKSMFIKNNLIDKTSEFSIGCFIAGDNDLSIQLFSTEQVEFSLKDLIFSETEKDKYKSIEIPKHFKKSTVEDEDKDEDYFYFNVNFSSYKNDLMLHMTPIEQFVCNGKSCGYISVDEIINYCKEKDIKINHIWVGWEY